MHSKTLLAISFAAAIAGMPVKSEARADRNGLSACASALTDQLASAQGAPVDFRLNDGLAADKRRSSSAGVWYLDARDPKTQEVVARVDCRVNSRAQVVSLEPVPLSASDARERADIE
jgi:hypothetical protein